MYYQLRSFIVRSVFLIIAIGVLSSCATAIDVGETDDSGWLNHVIAADKRGAFDAGPFPNGVACKGPAADEAFGVCQLNAVMGSLEKRIETAGDDCGRARDQTKLMVDSGIHPIFLTWRSTLVDSYVDQTLNVRAGRRIDAAEEDKFWRETFPKSAAPLILIQDLAVAIVHAPATWVTLLGGFMSRQFSRRGGVKPEDKENRQVTELQCSEERLSFGVAARGPLADAITFPVRGVTGPVVDVFGDSAWANMRRVACATLRPELPDAKDITRTEERGDGPFAKFASRFEQLLDTEIGGGRTYADRVEVSLVGHSMGAMIANDMVRDFDLGYTNIVYLGAASSIRHFYNTVVPYLETSESTRFFNLMLNPANENRQLTRLGILPRGSLLEWIDNMFEEADSPFDRTLGKWVNLEPVVDAFPDDASKQMTFKVFGLDQDTPVSHGEFSEVLYQRGRRCLF